MRSDINWWRLAAEYMISYRGKDGVSFAKLAKKYGVPLSTVERHAAKDRWAAGRREVRRRVQIGMGKVYAELRGEQ